MAYAIRDVQDVGTYDSYRLPDRSRQRAVFGNSRIRSRKINAVWRDVVPRNKAMEVADGQHVGGWICR